MSDERECGWAKPSSLYLHIPFCPYKCPYCDFVTHVGSPSLVEPYVAALCGEIASLGRAARGSDLHTIYLGGGTPAMLAPNQIARILGAVRETFDLVESSEVTIEANPGEVLESSLQRFLEAGVNRISFGAQSMNDRELIGIGRGHAACDVVSSVESARRAGFRAISVDLIYGIPNQTLQSWRSSLEAVMDLDVEHMSLYSLIVEPGTVFNRRKEKRQLDLPPDDDVADMYEMACEEFARAGFSHYEIANWAKPGYESRHNITYWHDEQFFAVGVGAYDYVRPHRSVRLRSVRQYIDAVSQNREVVVKRDLVTAQDERFETVILGLRLLHEGITRGKYRRRFGEDLDERYGMTINELTALGLLVDDGMTLRIPEHKVMVANEVWGRFLP